MTLTQDDFVSAVVRLNDLTRRQVIKWTPCSPPAQSTSGPGSAPDLSKILTASIWRSKVSFETTYDGRVLRITQYESPTSGLSGSYKYSLDLKDPDGNISFEFPTVAGISDLFRSVQTQLLDIEGFVKRLATG